MYVVEAKILIIWLVTPILATLSLLDPTTIYSTSQNMMTTQHLSEHLPFHH